MALTIESLQNLTDRFATLSGVGKKSAQRMAYSVLNLSDEDAELLAQAIVDARQRIHRCPVCMNLTDLDVCSVCADETRDHGVICVVSDPRTAFSMEKVREFRGVYHVLHGTISPLDGITPDMLTVRELLDRVKSGQNEGQTPVREVILATNADVEGEATAMYLARILQPLGVRVTRLAYGISVGTDIEYADEVTLFRALAGRRDMT